MNSVVNNSWEVTGIATYINRVHSYAMEGLIIRGWVKKTWKQYRPGLLFKELGKVIFARTTLVQIPL